MKTEDARSGDRRPSGLLIAAVAQTVLMVGGVISIVLLRDELTLPIAILCVLIMAVWLFTLVLILGRLKRVRDDEGVRLGQSTNGDLTTIITRRNWAVGVTAVSMTVFGLVFAIAGVSASVKAAWWLGVPLIIIGLWSLSFLLPLAAGRIKAGGLYLSANGVEYRTDALLRSFRWDDVTDVAAEGPTVVIVLAAGASVKRRNETRWTWQFKDSSRAGELNIHARDLVVGASALTPLLLTYVRQPELRSRLGSEESLAAITSLGALRR